MTIKYDNASFHGAWLHIWNSEHKLESLVIYERNIYTLVYNREDDEAEIITDSETYIIELNEHTEPPLAKFMKRLNTPDENIVVPSNLEVLARPLNNSKALH